MKHKELCWITCLRSCVMHYLPASRVRPLRWCMADSSRAICVEFELSSCCSLLLTRVSCLTWAMSSWSCAADMLADCDILLHQEIIAVTVTILQFHLKLTSYILFTTLFHLKHSSTHPHSKFNYRYWVLIDLLQPLNLNRGYCLKVLISSLKRQNWFFSTFTGNPPKSQQQQSTDCM